MWDSSLRIRNMFLNTPMPADLTLSLKQAMKGPFQNQSVVVRSSAPGEDSSKASFAGLHESYVNVRGVESILEHIRLVWASLWSDGSLLYRQDWDWMLLRGGMLIHGAIIAREYGLPCVTGVPNATSSIHTGDEVTVDGYLGIVIIG